MSECMRKKKEEQMDNHPEVIMPVNETVFKTPQEEVYKSALEIILSLCENYTVGLMDIQAVCETVLKKGKEK